MVTAEEQASLEECVQGLITFQEVIARHNLTYERADALRTRKNRLAKAKAAGVLFLLLLLLFLLFRLRAND